MSTTHAPPGAPSTSVARVVPAGVRLDRLVLGLVVTLAGLTWLLGDLGVALWGWQVLPPVALMIVGLGLLATLAGGQGRVPLIWLGVLALVLAVAQGVGAERYTAPVGDVVVAPTVADWPVAERISAGNVVVDLSRNPLPDTGRLEVSLGAGNATVVLPRGAEVAFVATVTTGRIIVDGSDAGNGVDLSWSDPPLSAGDLGVTVTVAVALGQVEVRHV